MGLQFLKAGKIGANLSGAIKSIIRDILTGFVNLENWDRYDLKLCYPALRRQRRR